MAAAASLLSSARVAVGVVSKRAARQHRRICATLPDFSMTFSHNADLVLVAHSPLVRSRSCTRQLCWGLSQRGPHVSRTHLALQGGSSQIDPRGTPSPSTLHLEPDQSARGTGPPHSAPGSRPTDARPRERYERGGPPPREKGPSGWPLRPLHTHLLLAIAGIQ